MSVTMVGVDPGSRYTGVVSLNGDGVSDCCVMTRTTGDDLPDNDYIQEVLTEVAAQLEHADAIAVEGLVVPHGRAPSGEKMIMTVAGIMGASMIFGAVLARWPDAIVVEPGDNGALPDYAYPERIRKRARLGGPSTHARSAYDVARGGVVVHRATQQARRITQMGKFDHEAVKGMDDEEAESDVLEDLEQEDAAQVSEDAAKIVGSEEE